MKAALDRLFRPRSIAALGGQWCDSLIAQLDKLGYDGEVWHVNDRRESTDERTYYPDVDALPSAPDAAFLAIPAADAVPAARKLAERGVGGLVGFASGFSETGSEQGRQLADELADAVGQVPLVGPNCYGWINHFDRVALWPDQLVPTDIERGVAIVTQSGTLAINLGYNQRSLPIGYVITMGNQQLLSLEQMIDWLLEDPRVSAIGLYIEAIKDLPGFVDVAEKAREKGVPIAAVKAGRSDAAAKVTISHTGSIAGTDAGYEVLFERLGVARCESLAQLSEVLKFFHCYGPLPGNRVAFSAVSGGDCAMTSDVGDRFELAFPAFSEESTKALSEALGPRVPISNPLDQNTYYWFTPEKYRAEYRALLAADMDVAAFMMDMPDPARFNYADYENVARIFIDEASASGKPAAFVASLPECLPEHLRQYGLQKGVAPLQGLPETLFAFECAAKVGKAWRDWSPVKLVRPHLELSDDPQTLSEATSKGILEASGVSVPQARLVLASEAGAAADEIGYPVVLKISGEGTAHKSDLGGVVLNLKTRAEVERAAERLATLSEKLHVEQMVSGGVAEILVGVVRDPAFGPLLTIGAGGVLTELMKDVQTLLYPIAPEQVVEALRKLRVRPLLEGYRGAPKADLHALSDAICQVAELVWDREDILEIEVNPLIVRAEGEGVIAVDALMRVTEQSKLGDE